MLRVTLLGNLGADPELRYTSSGSAAASFRVAVNQIRKGPDGERQENTEWFRVTATGPRVEWVKRLTKGNRVMVVGRLQISHYKSRDGEPRTGFDVWADEVESMLPRPRDGDDDGETSDGAESAEPVLAGVSSLGGGEAANQGSSTTNGRGRRATQGASAAPADLEDLPF